MLRATPYLGQREILWHPKPPLGRNLEIEILRPKLSGIHHSRSHFVLNCVIFAIEIAPKLDILVRKDSKSPSKDSILSLVSLTLAPNFGGNSIP